MYYVHIYNHIQSDLSSFTIKFSGRQLNDALIQTADLPAGSRMSRQSFYEGMVQNTTI